MLYEGSQYNLAPSHHQNMWGDDYVDFCTSFDSPVCMLVVPYFVLEHTFHLGNKMSIVCMWLLEKEFDKCRNVNPENHFQKCTKQTHREEVQWRLWYSVESRLGENNNMELGWLVQDTRVVRQDKWKLQKDFLVLSIVVVSTHQRGQRRRTIDKDPEPSTQSTVCTTSSTDFLTSKRWLFNVRALYRTNLATKCVLYPF